MDNYFNYFTEIEDRFLRRRGGGLLLSTLDWALIETWKDAGIPLEAVLRGIDEAFDRYDQRPSKTKKVNSLAYCSQLVLSTAEDMKEAAVGATGAEAGLPEKSGSGQGFEPAVVAPFLRRNAGALEAATLPEGSGVSVNSVALDAAQTLRHLADEIERKPPSRLEDLERRLTVIEEKLFAALFSATPEDELVTLRAQADRELAPYRSKMSAVQLRQIQQQFLHKRLMQSRNLPRLSLFYMGHA